MKLYSMLCGSLDGRGVWERRDTSVYMVGSLCGSLETIKALFTNYIFMQNKSLNKLTKRICLSFIDTY